MSTNTSAKKVENQVVDLAKKVEKEAVGVATAVKAELLNNQQKWVTALVGAILFLVIASPFLFKLVNQLTSNLGLSIIDSNGLPNIFGLALHAIVFLVLARLLLEKL